MKILKYLLFAVGGIVLLVIVVLVLVVATFDPNKYKPEITAVVKDRIGRTLAIEGKLGLTFFPSLGFTVGKLSLSEPNSSAIFARVEEAKASLALVPLFSRQVVVDRVTFSGLQADLVKRKDGKTNFGDLMEAGGPREPRGPARPKPQEPAPQKEAMHLDIAGVEIRSSTLSWRDEAAGSQLKLTVEEFKTGRIASGVPGKLSLSASLAGAQPSAALQVKLAASYRLDFEKQRFDFSGIDIKLSEGATGPATSLKGEAQIALDPQAIQFDFAVDRLDLDRFLGSAKGKTASAGKTGAGGGGAAGTAVSGGGANAEEPIDLSALRGLNLKGGLKIGELVVSNVKAEKVDVGVRAAGGRVDISPLAASLYQGNLSGNASVNANTNRIALKGELSNVAVGPLLHDALNNNLLEGRGNLALDVETGGTTVSAMKKALAGSAKLTLRDGALKGINLEEAIRKARALAGRPVQEQGTNRGERTDLTELGASFVIRNGVAHNDDLSGKSPLFRLTGSGDVNIGANSIDYVAKASVVETSGGQGGKGLAELRGVTVPVKITGSLEEPRFRVDLGAAVGDAVRKRAEDRVKEGLQDRLKDLFKR